MSKIRILSENLANKIAAGEVVERPASVVKELVENAIDAGATNLAVQVEGGGTSLIRVIDDGLGMDEDDILLSLERHATSKIAAAEEIDHIKTLGFRGEAVPSIASVSRMSITSRTADDSLGYRVEVRFGKVMKVHEMGCQKGTVVEVRDLFGNVPARKKFLKTSRTELAHIEEIIKNYGLVLPDLTLHYSVNGKETLSLPAAKNSDHGSRLKRLLGLRENLLLLDLDTGHSTTNVAVSGFMLPPDQPAAPSARLKVFVNGRPVKDRMISHAVSEGMRNFLMKGRYPSGVIFLDLPAGSIDVNVHPTKQEVRFHNSNEVHKDIVSAVSQMLFNYQSGLKEKLFGTGQAANDQLPSETATTSEIPLQQLVLSRVTKNSSDFTPSGCDKMENIPVIPMVAEPISEFETGIPGTHEERARAAAAEVSQQSSSPEAGETVKSNDAREFGHLKVIGQLFDSYILCEGNDGLIAIDQHAAQERFIFEKLKAQLGKGKLVSQSLMFPKTLELAAEDIAIVEAEADEITRLGVEIAEFGGSTYVLKAIPAVLAHLPPEEILSGILQQISGESSSKRGRGLDSVLAGMACKAAIKANHTLDSAELESLIKEMQANDVFSHCPHGRPVVRIFSENEIRKWFYRT